MSERFGQIISESEGQRFGDILSEPEGQRFGEVLSEPEGQRFGEVVAEPKSKRAITRRERQAEQKARKTIAELEALDPRDLTPEQEARLREALTTQMEVAEADRANADADLTAAENEMSIPEKLGGVSMDVLESGLGVGDEAGALTNMLFSGDDYDTSITKSRQLLDDFEARNPKLSKFATGAGLAGGLMIPGATALKVANTGGKLNRVAKGAGIGALEGTAYGGLAGRGEEGRIEGAQLGFGLGGALGALGGYIGGKTDIGKTADARKQTKEYADSREADLETQIKTRTEDVEQARIIIEDATPEDLALVRSKSNRTPTPVPGLNVLQDEADTATQLEDLYFLRELDDEAIDEIAQVQVAELYARGGNRGDANDTVRKLTGGDPKMAGRRHKETTGPHEESPLGTLPREPRLVEAIKRQAKKLEGADANQLDELRGDVLSRHGVTDFGKGDVDGSMLRWVNDKAQRVVMPTTTLWRKWTGDGFAGKMERALVHALPKKYELDAITNQTKPLIQAVEESKVAKAHLLNATNNRLPEKVRAKAREDFRIEAGRVLKYNPLVIRALMDEYDTARAGVVNTYNGLIGEAGKLRSSHQLHTQLQPPSNKWKTTFSDESKLGRDQALMAQERGFLDVRKPDHLKKAEGYQNPYYTDNRWLRERIQDTEVAKAYQLRPATKAEQEAVEQGTYVRDRIVDKAEEIGVKGEGLKEVQRLADATLVDSLEGVGPLLSILRSTNITTGIANPKSAALNFSEPFIMAMEHNMVDIAKAYAKQDGIPFTARELGLAAVQAGDELRRLQKANKSGALNTVDEAANWFAEKSMKASGFEASTLYTQNVSMQAALNKATRIANSGKGKIGKAQLAKFDEEYGTWYTKTQQMNLMRALKKIDKSKSGNARLTATESALVKDFQLMSLNEWQPLTAMGRSYANNKYPLVRPFLLFTTYTTRMHDAIARKAGEHLTKSRALRRDGKTAKANAEVAKAFWSYMGRLMYSQSLYAVTNQARQHVFGQGIRSSMTAMGYEDDGSKTREYDRFDAEGLGMDFLLSLPSQAVGGLVPNNEFAYRGSISKFKDGDIGQGVLKLGEEISEELFTPTAILIEAAGDSLKDGDLDPLMKRLPVVGPAVRVGMRYDED